MSVDWSEQLWPASFKGVPFWVDKDTEKGGRRLGVHEFIDSDTPFIEDIGKKATPYAVTAYLVGDTSDVDAAALSATFNSAGSGTLVLPLDGPVPNCSCDTFTRNRSKDKMGLVAYDAHFWVGGAPTAVVSSAYASQLAYDSVAALADAMAAIPAAMALAGMPGWVAEAAIAALQESAVGLEAIRAQGSVDPAQNLAITQAIAGFYAALPGLVSQVSGADPSIPATAVSLALTLVTALPAASASAAFGAAYDALPASLAPVATATANAQAEQVNASAASRLARLTMLAGYAEAVIGMSFESRADGVAARTALVGRFAGELGQTMGAANAGIYVALENLRAAMVSYLTKQIADLRPVVIVSAPRMLPSLWWAWRLYQDPAQASGIVARNKTRHPSFCQESLEVLAPPLTSAAPV